MTGMPFVWSIWAAHPDTLHPAHIEAFQTARDRGEASVDEIAASHFPDDPEQADVARSYLQDNIIFHLTDRNYAGMNRFFAEAAAIGIAPPMPSAD